MGCGSWCWEVFESEFRSRGHRVVMPDLRHEGLDARRPLRRDLAHLGLSDYLADVLRVFDRIEGPTVIVGHSLGGLLAQLVAVQRRPLAIVLVSPMPPAGCGIPGPHAASLFWRSVSSVPWGWRQAASLEAQVIKDALRGVPPELAAQFASRIGSDSVRVLMEIGFWWLDLTNASTVPAKSVRCPVLCVGGVKDPIATSSLVAAVAARYADSNHLEYPDNTHWLPLEPGGDAIARDILDWVAQC